MLSCAVSTILKDLTRSDPWRLLQALFVVFRDLDAHSVQADVVMLHVLGAYRWERLQDAAACQ